MIDLLCVHVQSCQAVGEACPSIAVGHWLFSKLFGSHSQWPNDLVGNGLACSCLVAHSHLEPGGKAHHISGQDDLVVPSLLVLGGIRQ